MNYTVLFNKLFENALIMSLEKNAELAISGEKTKNDYDSLKLSLIQNGCKLYTEKSEGDNLFATFTDAENVINISFTPFENKIRLIWDKTTLLPPKDSDFEKVATPLITQVRNPYFVCDCGMTYIIRLEDGRFVIIDGGEGEYDEIEHTMDILRTQNVLEGKPVIAVWFITHAHSDHFNGLVQLMDKHGDDITVERLVYDWSVPSLTCAMSPLGDFNRVVEAMKNTEIITARSGQVYNLAGTTFEILFACEDLYPDFIKTLNDTSIVFRMTMNGRRVMWLGDNMGQAADYITKKYSAELLKCEFLQVGHHGYWGGSQKLHEMMDPEVLLWPCPDFWYQEIKDWDCNRFFKESQNIKHKLVCGQKEITLDMTKPVEENKPYEKNGDTILSESFDGGSVYGLHMSHITGGSTGYASAKAEFSDNGLKLTSGGARSVLELVQPGFVEGEPKITLELSGSAENKCGVLGLVFNNPHPTVWSDIKLLKLDADGRFNYTLELDYNNGSGTLYESGKPVKNIRFVKQDRACGIYLVMKNSEIILDKFSLLR